MANFAPPPFVIQPFKGLAPELIPQTVVGVNVGVGAGLATATGAPVGGITGQVINVGAGAATATGAPVVVALGTVPGIGVGPGAATVFGNSVGVGITGVAPPPPTPAITPFAPALSELGVDAWERLGKRLNDITVQHITSMRRSMNLVLVRWANRGINLWKVQSGTLTLRPGVATYTLPANLIEMLDTYITTTTDIIMTPMGRDTYAALPNKTVPGRPILYWFDRTVTPTVTLWPVPDTTTAYTLTYYGWSQIGDVDMATGNTPDLPYRLLEAFTAGVAAHLAIKWAEPQRALALDAYAKETFEEAADADREVVTLVMQPNLDAYYS